MNDTAPADRIRAQAVYAVVPEWVIYADVSANAVRLYATLQRHANHSSGECYPGRSRLAVLMRCSVDTVDRALKELVTVEAVTVEHRRSDAGDMTSNRYTVMTLPPGVAATVRPPSREDAGTGGRTSAARTKALMDETPLPPAHGETADGAPLGCAEHRDRRRSSCDACMRVRAGVDRGTVKPVKAASVKAARDALRSA